MTAQAAIKNFFSSFGVDAFPNTSVPDKKDRPKKYITYEISLGAFDDGPVAIGVNVWARTTGETIPNNIVRAIEKKIARGGYLIECDGGGIWLTRGTPWCQAIPDEDPDIKRRFLNITLDYLTP